MDRIKSILGIDLGTSSLGYAVIVDEKGGKPHIHSGVDIFPAAKDYLGQGDKEESNNASRRLQRQMRRQYFRKRLRKQHLLALLIEYDMCPLTIDDLNRWRKWDREMKSITKKFPDNEEFQKWLALNPYELRYKAVTDSYRNQLTKHEFGRILYSMIQRRGFLSSRKSSDEGMTLYQGKEGIKGITDTQDALHGQTLGAYLYSIGVKKGIPYSQGAERIRSRYTLRDMYILEFERIWAMQAEGLGLADAQVKLKRKRIIKGKPDSNDNKKRMNKLRGKFGDVVIVSEKSKVDDSVYHYFVYHEEKSFKEHLGGKIWYEVDGTLRYRSNESVLFWQRPLRSQKGLLDRCTYEGNRFYDKRQKRWVVSGPRVIPVSHPLFEVYRTLQQVMQIKINDQLLPESLSVRVFNYFLLETNRRTIKLSEIKRKFKLVGRFNYDDDYTFSASYTVSNIKKLIKKIDPISDPVQKDLTFPLPFNMDLYTKIWHKLYNYDDNKLLEIFMISSYQAMWILVIFDLPVLTKKQMKAAREFRDHLIRDGFIMAQYSVYMRHVPTLSLKEKHIRRVSRFIPEEGSVIVFTMTDKQYADARYFIGRKAIEPCAQPTLFDQF